MKQEYRQGGEVYIAFGEGHVLLQDFMLTQKEFMAARDGFGDARCSAREGQKCRCRRLIYRGGRALQSIGSAVR